MDNTKLFTYCLEKVNWLLVHEKIDTCGRVMVLDHNGSSVFLLQKRKNENKNLVIFYKSMVRKIWNNQLVGSEK